MYVYFLKPTSAAFCYCKMGKIISDKKYTNVHVWGKIEIKTIWESTKNNRAKWLRKSMAHRLYREGFNDER